MHLLGGETPGQLAQEGQELLMPVAGGTGIVDATGIQVQGGPQGERAVADVVVGAGGGAAGGRGQSGLGAGQGLHLGASRQRTASRCREPLFFVDREHIAQLGLELRVVGELEGAHAVGLDAGRRPPALQVPD